MARPHPLVVALVTAAAAATAGAQDRATSGPAGPRAFTAVGALPRAARAQQRAAARGDARAAQPPRTAPAGQPVRYSIAGGLAQPSGDLGDGANTGFTVFGSADFRPTGFPIGLRGDLSFTRFTGEQEEDSDVDESLTLIGAQLNGVIRFGGQGQAAAQPSANQFRPYVLGGLGLYRSAYSISDGDGDDDSEDEIVLGFGFGGGIEFNLGTYETFLEARYQTVSTDDTAEDGISFIPIVFGFRF